MKKILSIIIIGVFATLVGMPIGNECVANNNYLHTTSGASTLKGNKHVVTRDVWVQDFKKIKIMVDADIRYSQSEDGPQVLLTLDENLHEMFDIHVEVNTLILAPKEKYKGTKIQPTKFVVEISSEKLEMITINSNARFDVQTEVSTPELKIENTTNGRIYSMKAINVEELEIENTGNGNITLVGKADEANILQTAGGKINMENCAVSDCTCENSGSGDIYIYAVDFLTCQVFGKGNVYYMGDPKIKKDVVGTGRLIRR